MVEARMRIARAIGAATVIGTLAVGAAAAGVLAVPSTPEPTPTNPNGVVTTPETLPTCAEGFTESADITIADYIPDDATPDGSAIGFKSTFHKNGFDTEIAWTSAANTVSQILLTSNHDMMYAVITYDPAATADPITTIDEHFSFDTMAVCYAIPATPTPTGGTGGEAPTPTSTVAAANEDNGTWKLVLIGIGGILATLAVVTPRRFGKRK